MVDDFVVRGPLIKRDLLKPPDGPLLERLARIQRACVLLVGCSSTVILAGWSAPWVADRLPAGWALMKANSALLALCCALSLLLMEPNRPRWAQLGSRILSVFTALLALAVVLEYAWPGFSGVDTWLAADPYGQPPGRMAVTTAVSFALLSAITLLLRTRRARWAAAADVLCWILCGMVLVTTYRYVFGAIHLGGHSTERVTSPQTLACLILLTFAAFGPRTGEGIFHILLGPGIGGRIARFASPFTFVVPFAVEVARDAAEQAHVAPGAYLAALAAAVSSMLAFGLVLILALRINGLEEEVRALSLRDELTQVYNRRGFQVAANQSLLLARRSQVPFSVLYIDLDNLKEINDTLGHEVGSRFISEVGHLLKTSFRASDVVGRVGGDEFVVAGASSAAGIAVAVAHLAEAVAKRNARSEEPYPLSFSIGHVTSEPGRRESLDALLKRADDEMYRTKRNKKQLRTSQLSTEAGTSAMIENPR